ncbi:MAG: hypothetical protein ACSLFN_16390 [Candidatus Limnocylindrales bacterium]
MAIRRDIGGATREMSIPVQASTARAVFVARQAAAAGSRDGLR